MATRNRLELLKEVTEELPPSRSETTTPAPTTSEAPRERAWVLVYELTLAALQLLSQRTVQLAASLLPLIALGLGAWLAWRILDNPTGYQLGALGIYAAFALLMLLIVRRR